jgi:hypothetical protein
VTSIDDLRKISFERLSNADQRLSLKKGALFLDKANHSDRNDFEEISSSRSKKEE